MLLLAVSLVCACSDVEPLPGEDDKDKVENEGGQGGSDDSDSGNQGGEGNEGGSGNEGNEGGNEGGSGNEGTQTPAEQAQIVITPASKGWPTSYPTSQRAFTLDDY